MKFENIIKTNTCYFCGESEQPVVIVSFEDLFVEQKRELEIKRNFYKTSRDAEVPGKISYIQDYESALVRCRDCGLIYRDPKPSFLEIVSKYEEESFCREYDELWMDSWKRIFNRFLDRIEDIKPEKGRLLDIGCQLGLLPELAFQRGWQASGVDPSEYTASQARKRGVDIFQGVLKEAKFSNRSFDVVTALLVFENLPNFKEELIEIQRILMKRGLLVLKIGNFDFYNTWRRLIEISGKTSYPLEVILSRLHLMGFPYQFGFSPETIRQFLLQTGYGEVEIRNYQLFCSIDKTLKPEIRLTEGLSKKGINFVASTISKATKGKVILGPWLEVYASKT